MIGLDTNILLRALTNDDADQSPVAARIIGALTPERPGYINLVVLAELAWSLKRKFGSPREDVLSTVETILQSPAYVVENRDAVIDGLEIAAAEKLHFADALIAALNRRAACTTTLTFDRKAGESRFFSPATP